MDPEMSDQFRMKSQRKNRASPEPSDKTGWLVWFYCVLVSVLMGLAIYWILWDPS